MTSSTTWCASPWTPDQKGPAPLPMPEVPRCAPKRRARRRAWVTRYRAVTRPGRRRCNYQSQAVGVRHGGSLYGRCRSASPRRPTSDASCRPAHHPRSLRPCPTSALTILSAKMSPRRNRASSGTKATPLTAVVALAVRPKWSAEDWHVPAARGSRLAHRPASSVVGRVAGRRYRSLQSNVPNVVRQPWASQPKSIWASWSTPCDVPARPGRRPPRLKARRLPLQLHLHSRRSATSSCAPT
jgi:hypothetical protein